MKRCYRCLNGHYRETAIERAHNNHARPAYIPFSLCHVPDDCDLVFFNLCFGSSDGVLWKDCIMMYHSLYYTKERQDYGGLLRMGILAMWMRTYLNQYSITTRYLGHIRTSTRVILFFSINCSVCSLRPRAMSNERMEDSVI